MYSPEFIVDVSSEFARQEIVAQFLRGLQNSPTWFDYDAEILADFAEIFDRYFLGVAWFSAGVQSWWQVYCDLQ